MSRRWLRWCLTALIFAAGATPAAGETLCDPSWQDCRAPLLNLINNETVGLDVAFWFMQDTRYETAILNRWNAGVPVRVLVDPRANDTYVGNAQVLSDLAAAGIPMRYRTASGILHWKMMAFAGQNVVEFAGANYSPTAFVYQSPYGDYEDEAIYFSDDPSIVNSFKTEYDNLWLDTANYANYANIAGPLTRVYPIYPKDPGLNFPQQEDYAQRILKRYAAESQKLDVIMYRITDERHTDAMIQAMQRGVPVRIYSDTYEYRNSSRLWHAYNLDKLYAAGIPIRVRAHAGLNHQKLVLMYGQGLTVFGSSNWTSPSANQQQEHNYFTTKSWIFQWFQDMFERKWNNTAPNGAIESQPFVPLAPDKPVYIAPADGAVGTLRSVELQWDGGPWGQMYDVYFGTDPNPPLLAANQQLGPDDPAAPSYQKWILPLLQPGTTYYWRIVSKTMAGMAAKGPVASFTTAGSPPPPPQPSTSASTIVMWTSTDVASGGVFGNWQWLSDSTAAGGSALWNPDKGQSKISPPLAAPGNYFETTFNAVGGVPYHLWIRLRAQNNSTSNNSVSVQFSNAIDQYGSPLYPIGSAEGAEIVLTDPSGMLNDWGWEDNGYNGAPATLVYFPASGTETIRVQQRSDGAIVDQIVLSPDAFLSTAPGGTLNNTTIYGSTVDGAAPPPPPPPTAPSPPDVPAPFQQQDIGAVGLPGYATFDSTSTFTIVAAGADVWGAADAFHYVYQPLNGDGSIVARVAGLQNVNSWSKAGVMIRETLAPGASNAFMLVSAAKGLSYQARAATGGTTSALAGPSKAAAPYWVRLDRAGNTFTAYYSSTGSTWTALGSATIAMASNAYVGMAVASHNADIDTTAVIDNVAVNGVPVVACNASISPASATLASGGDGAIVSVAAANTCAWTATSSAGWLAVTNGSSGTGNGSVTVSAAPNDGGTRVATVAIAGLTFTATQSAAPCSYSISPTSQAMPSGGGSIAVPVATGGWCTWSAVSSDPTWLTVASGASGTGSGTVTLSVAPNSGPARTTTATIAGQIFAVSQDAAACTFAISPAAKSLSADASTIAVGVTTGSWCSWTASSNAPVWLVITSGASGTGAATVTLTAAANGGPARTGTAAIAGQTFTASQAAAPLPGSWANQDVGATGKMGSSIYDWSTSTFTVKGAGADVWGTADAFQYAYRPLAGDGVMIARVATISSTATWVKAGVMIRESLDPGSAHAFMLVSYSKGTAFQRRTLTGGTSVSTTGPTAAAPYWVKVERVGSTIKAYTSADGAAWTLVGSDTFAMAPNVLIGLAVSSHVTGTLATATFDNVSAPSAPCTYTVSPASQSFAASGGTASVAVTTDAACTWSATSSDPGWLTVSAGATGSGNGVVTLAASANAAGPRSATVTIAGQTFTASQSAAACAFSISPGSQTMATGGDTGAIAVTTSGWCTWTATSSDPGWLTVTSGGSGTGSGTVAVSAAANPAGARTATVTIGDQLFTATQGAAACSYAISPASQSVGAGGGTAAVTLTTGSWCGWSAASDATWLTFTSASSGTGSATIAASAAANGGPARTGTITAAGLISTVSQAASALPDGWTSQDVGAVGKAGSSAFDWSTNTFTIKGAGADVWGAADAFQFAYRQMTGDGVVVARVASVSNTAAWVKAGVMIRETLDPGSTHAFMLASYSKGLAFQRRTVTGGTTVSTAGAAVVAPYWVKLERAGSTFNAYSSPDGATWTLVGTDTIPMASTVYVGLAVSSHTTGALATATFDNVSTP